MRKNDSLLLSALEDYFHDGVKKSRHTAAGVEVEHFILHPETGEALPYEGENGVSGILSLLMERYPNAEAVWGEQGSLLGFTVPEFSITLEPAAQLEISISYTESVEEIEKIYRDFREHLDAVLKDIPAAAYMLGCQPVSQIKDLKLIPKRRYYLMDRYFCEAGTDGANMMRGTCATQVSVDYYSEEDFRRKIQTAYYYSPLLKLLSNNSPVFEGSFTGSAGRPGYLKRTDIWRRTDPLRCGVLPGVFDRDYGFRDYAAFLSEMPLIFRVKDGTEIYTGMEKTKQIFPDEAPDLAEILHILSMAFPDVRLKQYLEIRSADAMPAYYVGAYCALVKGLLYSEEVLDHVQSEIRANGLSEASVLRAEDELMEAGWDGKIYGIPAVTFAEEALALAMKKLDPGEQAIAERFREVIGTGIPVGEEILGWIPAEEMSRSTS